MWFIDLGLLATIIYMLQALIQAIVGVLLHLGSLTLFRFGESPLVTTADNAVLQK
jgi:hypothetical protein